MFSSVLIKRIEHLIERSLTFANQCSALFVMFSSILIKRIEHLIERS